VAGGRGGSGFTGAGSRTPAFSSSSRMVSLLCSSSLRALRSSLMALWISTESLPKKVKALSR
jgi:hypothetical protein